MWKDYFYFNQREKRATLFLSFILFSLILFNALIPQFSQSESKNYDAFIQKTGEYYALVEADSIRKAAAKRVLAPDFFRIDTVSKEWLIKHGMDKSVTSALINYRDKGGVIADAEKFRSVYGMKDSIYDVWNKYVVYPSKKTDETSSIWLHTNTLEKTQQKNKPDFQIDINTADTAMFTVLYGIGPTFADRIVKYRAALGGFHNVEQVREVYGMDSARYRQILPYLTIQEQQLKKISINKVSLKQIKNHPYFNFYQAKAVYEFRNSGKSVQNWDEFVTIPGLDTTGMKYLPPYLDYSEFITK